MNSASLTSDLRVFVANCLMGEDDSTEHSEIRCGNFKLLFRQSPELSETRYFSRFDGRFVETTEILVKSIAPEQVDEALSVVARVCWLLSFACLSHVVYFRHEFPDGSGLGCRKSCRGVTSYFRPSLDIRDGSIVKSFVKQTYDKYCQLEQSRQLNVVIDYLVQAEQPSQPTELKLVLAFVILENMKHTFAYGKGLPYIKNYYRRGPYPAWKKSPRYQFKDLLTMMFSEMGMNSNLDAIITLRNEIIHSGVSQLGLDEQNSMYGEIHDLIRKYLFRLLGYHGNIPTYSSRGCEFIAV